MAWADEQSKRVCEGMKQPLEVSSRLEASRLFCFLLLTSDGLQHG